MSTFQSLQNDMKSFQSFTYGFFLVVQFCSHITTSGAAYDKLTFRLIIQVEKDVSFQSSLFQMIDTIHTSFLIHCKQGFQRTVLQCIVFKNGHSSSHANAIVTAKGCAFRFHPVAVNISLDRVCQEIMVAVGSLLGNHIHVALKCHRLAVLQSFRSRFTEDDVSSVVLERFNVAFLGPIKQELLN